MKLILAILLISSTVYGQTINPFLNLRYDKVIMYDFAGGKGSDLYIVDKGVLAKSIRKEVVLDKQTISELNNKLGSRKSYGGGTAACFDPHLGFVYYLENKIIAHVTVCLDCNRLSSNLEIEAQKQNKVGKGDKAYYLGEGLSDSFKGFLYELVDKNHFSHGSKKKK